MIMMLISVHLRLMVSWSFRASCDLIPHETWPCKVPSLKPQVAHCAEERPARWVSLPLGFGHSNPRELEAQSCWDCHSAQNKGGNRWKQWTWGRTQQLKCRNRISWTLPSASYVPHLSRTSKRISHRSNSGWKPTGASIMHHNNVEFKLWIRRWKTPLC